MNWENLQESRFQISSMNMEEAVSNNSLYLSIGVTTRNWEGKPITIITIETAKHKY